MPFKENLQVARKVLKQIKAEVTTSDDIIPRTELPIITLANMASDIAKFGDRMHEILAYDKFAEKLRHPTRFSATIARLERERKPSPMTTAYVAITMMGVGECADTSCLAMALLCRYRCPSLVNAIYLAGVKPNGEPFEHILIIIGDCDALTIGDFPPLTEDTSPFQQLSDDCVLIDPLLGVVGKAQDIQQVEKEKNYFETFLISKITNVVTLDPRTSHDAVEAIFENARQLSDEWCRELGGKYIRREIKEDKAHHILLESSQMQFGKSLGVAVREQLKRITGEDKNWAYSAKENCAYLVMEKESLTGIASYLQSKGITIRSPAKVKDSDNYLITVARSDFEKLKMVEAMIIPLDASATFS